jgi:hypothetical protein
MQLQFTAIINLPTSTTQAQLDELKHQIGEYINQLILGNTPIETPFSFAHLQYYHLEPYNLIIPRGYRLVEDNTPDFTPPI